MCVCVCVLGAISLAALNRWQMYSILRWAFTSPPGQKRKMVWGKNRQAHASTAYLYCLFRMEKWTASHL